LNFFGGDDTTGQVKVFLDDVIRAQEKVQRKNFFSILKKKLAKISIFIALDWPFSVCGWQVMAKKYKLIS